MTLSFVSREDDHGIEVADPVERRTCTLETAEPVRPAATGTEPFYFPVDEAVAVETSAIALPTAAATHVRDDDGVMLASVGCGTTHELSSGTHNIELSTPVKIYLRVEGAVTVTASFDRVAFEFPQETTVLVGARSHHRRPEATVTTTADPVDLMAAVSTFGSALKTTSPERSFPTLRGHPPALELGDELRIPDGVVAPDTGIHIELPPNRRHVYVAAPLAYYLGAELVPGNAPRIVTDGFEHPLRTARGFENEVARVLKQTFFFDCLTRTEGYYPLTLHEREVVEPLANLDFADLYDVPVAERLERYLDVPYALVDEHVPEWQLSAHVEPTAENAAMLPFVVDDLAVVRTPRAREVAASEIHVPAVNEFVRSTAESSRAGLSLVEPASSDAMEQLWLGDDAPVGANKATVEVFRNRLDRRPCEGDIDITVVCNDRQMDEERTLADDVYGSRTELPFDVSIHRGLTADELEDVLASETQFLHYIGHIDENGFKCADGYLDARMLDEVGVEAFFLNACQSYEQGVALIEAGAIGGCVTLSDIINSGAVRVGKAMVRLLNRGFPLRAALDIARDRSIIGGQYLIVGDGNLDIAQTDNVVPMLLEIETMTDDEFELTPRSYVSSEGGLGTIANPKISLDNRCHLASGTLGTYTVTEEKLRSALSVDTFPVLFDDEFVWSNNVF